MKLIPFYSTLWESNSYLLINGTDALLIDAGVNGRDIAACLAQEGATLGGILLTHGHFDHTVSVDTLREATGAKLSVHFADAEMLTDAEKSALFVFFGTRSSHKPADIMLSHGDVIPFGNTAIQVIHTPGHSRGSVCYLADNMLFSGDTLFDGGYGRCDLYGGDMNALASSLGKLQTLDPNLTIYPGHGGSAPLGAALSNLFGLT